MSAKVYLGDGAYAEVDQFGDLVLTTSDGLRDTNRVVLGVDEVFALLTFGVRHSLPIARFIDEAVSRRARG